MPEPSLSIEGQAQRGAQPSQRPPEPPPVPIRIVKSPSEAADDATREAKADEHDAKDLDAQIRAASAAEAQWWPTWAAAILTAVGTGLLVWTLHETRRTARAAIDGVVAADRAAKAAERANRIAAIAAKKAVAAAAEANRISREAIVNDQRPWIEVKLSHVSGLTFDERGAHITVKATFVNHGRSPALNVFFVPNIVAGCGCERMEQMMKTWTPSPGHLPGEIVYPGSDLSTLTYPLTLTPDAINLAVKGSSLLVNIIAFVNYQSNVGTSYTTRIAYDVFARGEGSAIAIMLDRGNYAQEQISISCNVISMAVVT